MDFSRNLLSYLKHRKQYFTVDGNTVLIRISKPIQIIILQNLNNNIFKYIDLSISVILLFHPMHFSCMMIRLLPRYTFNSILYLQYIINYIGLSYKVGWLIVYLATDVRNKIHRWDFTNRTRHETAISSRER